MASIQLRHLRFLNMSAASGLLLIDKTFHVIADDEVFLSSFSDEPSSSIQTLRLSQNDLPDEAKSRKLLKPDFETLLWIPSEKSILAIPSGSHPNRMSGAQIQGVCVTRVNFSELYQFLKEQIPDLNIEGAAFDGNQIKFFHRGNGADQTSRVISLDKEAFLKDLKGSNAIGRNLFLKSESVDLGKVNGENLSFTDAASGGPDRIWFVAAAESGKSTYDDGKFLGATIGCLNSQNKILHQTELICPQKPEGLAVDLMRRKFYVVTDADDRQKSALLLEGDLPKFG